MRGIVVTLRPCGDRYATGILFEGNHFEPASDVRPLNLGVFGERPFDIGLWRDGHEPELRTQMRQVDSGTGEDRHAQRPMGVCKHIVGQVPGIEHLECAGHRRERAAGRVHLGPAFEDHHRAAAPGQVACRGQSGGPGTDDEYVDVVRGTHVGCSLSEDVGDLILQRLGLGAEHGLDAVADLDDACGAKAFQPGLVDLVLVDDFHVCRSAGPDRVSLVTDAMAAAGMADGRYWLGPLAVDVVNGIARVADSDTIAGSTATMDHQFRFAVEHSGLPRDEALMAGVRQSSVNPAGALGLPAGELAPGAIADAVVLDDDLAVTGVMRVGSWVVEPGTPSRSDSESS